MTGLDQHLDNQWLGYHPGWGVGASAVQGFHHERSRRCWTSQTRKEVAVGSYLRVMYWESLYITVYTAGIRSDSEFFSFQVNLFFLLNIVLVLVTKLRDTHRAESNMYMKAVRATLILVPLLGIQFVIFPWRPENRLAGEIYDYIMHILMHYQVSFTFRFVLSSHCIILIQIS